MKRLAFRERIVDHRARMGLRCALGIVSLAVAFFATSPVSAQLEELAGEAAEAVETVALDDNAQPLAVAEVVGAAETELLDLRALHVRVDRARDVSEITGLLPELRDQLSRLEQDENLSRLSARTKRELLDIREQWSDQQERTIAQRALLDDRAVQLHEEHDILVTAIAMWTATRDEARDTPMPQATAGRVDEVIRALRRESRYVVEAISHVAIAQRQMSSLALRAGEVVARIELAEDAYRARFFQRTHPVLPFGLSDGRVAPTAQRQWDAVWNQHVHGGARFFSRHGRRLGFFVLFALVFLAWVTSRRRVLGERSDEFSATRHPVLASFLVSAVVFGWTFRDTPNVLLLLVQLMSIPAILVLAPPKAKKLATVACVAFGLGWLDGLISEGTALARIGTLFVSAAICYAAFMAFRNRDHTAPTPYHVGKVIVALVTGAAFLATVLGFVPLGSALLNGACATAFFGVAILTVVTIVSELANILVLQDAESRVRMVRAKGRLIARRVRRVAEVIGVVSWLALSLRAFEIWGPIKAEGKLLLNAAWSVGELTVSLGDVLVFTLGLGLAFIVSRVVGFFLDVEVFPRTGLDQGISRASSMLVRYVIIGAGFLMALAAAGIELGQLSILVGALGVGIGFGLQNIVNNFVSGLILIFERPVKLGDTISAGDMIGEVKDIGIRASTIETIDGAEVIMPNADLISTSVVNWTHSNSRRRVTIAVGVAYGANLHEVLRVLERVVSEHEEALGRPKPQVLFVGFGDSSLDFEVLAWAPTYLSGLELQSTLGIAVYDALADAGIEIPFPQRDLHIRTSGALGAKPPEP